MVKSSGLRVLALWLLAAVCACAPSPPPSSPPPDPAARAEVLARCCARPETFPKELVALVEPAAEWFIPWARRLELRPPRLSAHPDALRTILAAARPLDIVTTRAKFHLAGRMARGATTHAMIYIGSEAELRRAGLWSHPALRPWHDAIRGGARFVEAIDPVVRLSTPGEALRADSVLLLRPRLDPEARAAAMGVLMREIGNRFDVHFRVDEKGCVFCTELVARAMPGLKLKVRTVYGRQIILPDDLAAMAMRGDGGLTFVAYVRGRRGGWDAAPPEALVADLAHAWR